MNRNQLILLLLVMAVVGAAGLILLKRSREAWASPEAKMGQRVLPDFQPNKIAAIHIKGNGELNLVRKNDIWRVQERNDYPANLHLVSDILYKLKDLKIVESDSVGPSQLDRVNLKEPGQGEGSGTLVEFKDDQGKVLNSLLLGKPHVKQQGEARSSPFMNADTADGRYLLVPSEPQDVLLVSNALADLAPNPQPWLNPDFFKVEKVKSMALVSTNPAASWKIARVSESAPWILADAKPNEKLDPHKADLAASKLAYAKFVDVSSNLPSAQTGLDKPLVFTAEGFDGAACTLNIGARGEGGNYYLTVNISGKQQQALAPWTFVVNAWMVDSLIASRAEMLEENSAAQSNTTPVPAPVPADVAPLLLK